MAEDTARTPLHDEHVALNARMAPFAGYQMPVWYEGITEEVRAVRSSAGVFDVSHMAAIRVFGFGALDYLQNLLTNDLDKIAELGAAQYTLMCDENGGIIDDLIVYHSGDLEYLIVANAGNHAEDVAWMHSHCPQGFNIVTESGPACPDDGTVEVVDESERTAMIAIQGPEALRIVRELGGDDLEIPARFHIGEGRLGDIPVLLARTGYTGEDGVEALCHADSAAALWRLLLSFPEVTPCGLGARDALRLEMGYPLHGSDISRDTDPVTAGLSWTVGWEKPEFIGRDAIQSVRERGASEKLVGLRMQEGIPRHGYPVLHEGVEVGKVASGTFSPTLGEGIALAYVSAGLVQVGTELTVRTRRRDFPAVVAKPPFVKDTSLAAAGS